MQTENIPVCRLEVFDEALHHFWMGELGGLMARYPSLEYPHKNDFFALLFVEEATGEVVIDHQKIPLNDAKIVVIKPGCINSINTNGRASGKIILFSESFFSLRYNNNILSQFSFLASGSRVAVRIPESGQAKVNLLLNMIGEEFGLRKNDTHKVLRSYINILLFELERLFRAIQGPAAQKPKSAKFQQFEKLVDKHFTEMKLPSYYASLLHVTPNYLNKICKEATGHTSGDLIRKRITIEAQRLIHFTDYSINEIADKLGFENVPYFVTFFKKQTSLTPEQFRKVEK